MIQKNRIMTKKGIIIFDRNIDVEKTQENGKKVCEVYAPLIQQRIYQSDYERGRSSRLFLELHR